MSATDPQGVPALRRRGRRREAEPRATLSTWVPAGVHDRIIALANREGLSVSATVKRLIILQLK